MLSKDVIVILWLLIFYSVSSSLVKGVKCSHTTKVCLIPKYFLSYLTLQKNSHTITQVNFTDLQFGVVVAETCIQYIFWAQTDCTRSLFKMLALATWSPLHVLETYLVTRHLMKRSGNERWIISQYSSPLFIAWAPFSAPSHVQQVLNHRGVTVC